MAIEGMWPTPTVCGNYNRKGSSHTSGDGLATAVANWPMPTSSENKYRLGGDSQQSNSLGAITRRESLNQGKNGQLNPDWVEWLMGWPIGWTSLEPMESKAFPWVDSWQEDPADSGKVQRAAHKIPQRVNRLKAIGNGQVPQVVALAWWVLSSGVVGESC